MCLPLKGPNTLALAYKFSEMWPRRGCPPSDSMENLGSATAHLLEVHANLVPIVEVTVFKKPSTSKRPAIGISRPTLNAVYFVCSVTWAFNGRNDWCYLNT